MTTAQHPFSAKLQRKDNLPPRKPKNAKQRPREYLTEEEIEKLRHAARHIGRHGHRDDTLILMAFRHGLRVGELITLRWAQVDSKKGWLHVKRLKHGLPSTHPLRGVELRALRKLKRDNPRSVTAPFEQSSNEQDEKQTFPSPSIPTCCATARAFIWRTRAWTPAPFKPTWVMPTLITPWATPLCPPSGLRIFGCEVGVKVSLSHV